MSRFLAALLALCLGGQACAVELPFSLGPITCRAANGIAAEIPRCKVNLSADEKVGSCIVHTKTEGGAKRHMVRGSATPIARTDLARGPDPLVANFHGITCWLMIPNYVSGYRCVRTAMGLDCTACLNDICYRARMVIQEMPEE